MILLVFVEAKALIEKREFWFTFDSRFTLLSMKFQGSE